MSISLLQIVQRLEGRVKDLEVKIAELAKQKQDLLVVVQPTEQLQVQPKQERKMCPKCGVKPNHFFHVKSCPGKKEEQKDAAIGPGTIKSP